MATLRLKFVLNEGRVGIPLDKLAGIATDTKEFLAMVAADLDLPGGEWIAVNFGNGSVVFDCERLALDEDSYERGKRGVRAILENIPIEDISVPVRPATRLKYSEIANRIAPRVAVHAWRSGGLIRHPEGYRRSQPARRPALRSRDIRSNRDNH
jgi:hypothetical protein